MDDRYTILDFVDSGSMAQVYRAHDDSLDREVALKVLREAHASDEEFVERFTREAKCAACLEHPNIVSVYDRGRLADGSRYIAMEYVPGGSLANRIAEHGPLTVPEAAEIARQVAGALEAAHARGIFHRDIKPHNILLAASGKVKVADFGIARTAAAASLSHTDRVLGTARYMSPGQSMGKPSGPRDDLYSLGVVMYEMLTGEVPFDAESPVALAHKHLSEPPRPPGELNMGITGEMETVVMRLLAKAPEDRYASAAELAGDLGRVRDGLAPAGSTMARGRRRSRRRRRALLTLAPVAVLVLIGALLPSLAHGPGKGGIVGSLEGPLGGPVSGEDGSDGTLSAAYGTLGQALLGPRQAVVPDVEGLSEKEARQRLAERGLGSEIRSSQSTEEDAGKVLEQSAPPGTEARQGSRLLLAVGESVTDGTAKSGSGSDGRSEGSGSAAHNDDQTPQRLDTEADTEAQIRSSPALSATTAPEAAVGRDRPDPDPPQFGGRGGKIGVDASGSQQVGATDGGKAVGPAKEPHTPQTRRGIAREPTVTGAAAWNARARRDEAERAWPQSSGQHLRKQAPQGESFSQASSAGSEDEGEWLPASRDHHPPEELSVLSPSVEEPAGVVPPEEIPWEGIDDGVENQYVPMP